MIRLFLKRLREMSRRTYVFAKDFATFSVWCRKVGVLTTDKRVTFVEEPSSLDGATPLDNFIFFQYGGKSTSSSEIYQRYVEITRLKVEGHERRNLDSEVLEANSGENGESGSDHPNTSVDV